MAEKCWYLDHNQKTCERGRKKECSVEYEFCSKDSDNYHKICDRVWNITDADLNSLDIKQLEKLEEDASVCLYMRKRTQALCIHPKCRDAGHSGAIKKIQNKIRLIKHALYKKDMDKLYQKWLDNPEDESIYDEYIKKPTLELSFPKIEDVSWETFFGNICKLNELKYVVNRWDEKDPVFPNQWGVIVFLESGEEYVSFNENKEEAFKELSSDLVNVFCTDKTYRARFWSSFKPVGWFDYKTGTTVLPPKAPNSRPVGRRRK